VADPREAGFALVADPAGMPPLSAFALGTPDYPDRSTTLVIAVPYLSDEGGFVLEGPGIRAQARLAAPLPAGFGGELARNHALFPQGVDCLFVAPGRIAGLPRSTVVRNPNQGAA
jgi:alpha-D-ribose 1-methylphosphonate 5-triphosphate synthase subunit PhnH